MVNNILDLKRKYKNASISDKKLSIQRQIDFIDNEIDKIIYQIYELREEEIKIIERNFKQ